jgi:co-chaperonin GroES (HSP10)
MRTVDGKLFRRPRWMRWLGFKTSAFYDEKWERLHEEAAQLLAERMEQHAAPTPPDHPVQDICLVYRIPNPYKSTSGLVLPEQFSQAHDTVLSHGILLSAGPEAMDVLTSHGILIGDYVKFARFAGEEEAAGRVEEAVREVAARGGTQAEGVAVAARTAEEERQKKKLLEIQVPFIHRSVDLQERLTGPRKRMEKVRVRLPNGAVEHQIIPV